MSPSRCACGHLESEHDRKILPTDPFNHCSGGSFAVDQFDPDDRARREVGCCCTSFVQADDYQLEEWGDRV